MTQQKHAYTLTQLSRFLTEAIAASENLQNVWVVGETCDLRVVGGHCYLDLIEKDPATGKAVARMPARIWASVFGRLSAQFQRDTGQPLANDMKVMMYVSVAYHPAYGLSLTVMAINSSFTLGDAMRRRREILERLQREGILEDNRRLPWPSFAQRIAIISAQGAAGYGDFVNQLCNNTSRLRFHARLFGAAMQGERTAPSIIAALDQIHANIEAWDCVVIIRGGGATADLAWFDNYDLAANIASFPIPVIIGIGHERDITVLDYVANRRVKTPTAAAEWLIERGEVCLSQLHLIAQSMLQAVTDRLSGCQQQLSYIAGQLPAAATAMLTRGKHRLMTVQASLVSIADTRFRPEHTRLQGLSASLAQAAKVAIDKQHTKLQSAAQLLDALSPKATLRRGYTITRVAGHAATAASIKENEVIETVFADGSAFSIIQTINKE